MTILHLIWKGKGWLVIAVTFGCSLVAEILTRVITHDNTYYETSPYPISAALLAASIIIFFLCKKIESEEETDVHNLNAEEDKKIKTEHSFFFIPMIYWVPIILGCILLIFFVRT